MSGRGNGRPHRVGRHGELVTEEKRSSGETVKSASPSGVGRPPRVNEMRLSTASSPAFAASSGVRNGLTGIDDQRRSSRRGRGRGVPVGVRRAGQWIYTAAARDERAAFAGSARQVAADLRWLEALGVDHVLWIMDTAPADQLEALAELYLLVAS
jgi:hypothetical protein